MHSPVAFVAFILPKWRVLDVGSASAPGIAASRAPAVAAAAPVPTEHGVVSHIVDGDTLDMSVHGNKTRIRLLNVDTAETVIGDSPLQCRGPEASARLIKLAPNGSRAGRINDVERAEYERGTGAGGPRARGAVRAPKEAGFAAVRAAVKRAQAAILGISSGRSSTRA